MTDTNRWDAKQYEKSSYLQETMTHFVLADYLIDTKARVLDIGCGDGRISAHIASLVPGGRVTAIDRSTEMILHAAPTHREVSNLEFFALDALELEEQEGFNQVVSFFCLHWVEDQVAVLKRIHQALRPGGKLLLVLAPPTENFVVHQLVEKVARSKTWRDHFSGYQMPGFFRDVSKYRPFLTEAGFQIDSVELEPRPLSWPNLESFKNFVAALPLFPETFAQVDKDNLIEEITFEYLNHCKEHYQGALELVVNPLVVKAHK